MMGKKTETEPMTPQQRLRRTEVAVVERVKDLLVLRDELDAAQQAVRSEAGAFASVPQLYTQPLFAACAATQRTWAQHRRALVDSDAPPPKSKLEIAISEARADIKTAEQMLADYQAKLNAAPSQATTLRHQLQALTLMWADSLTARRARLADLLREGPQTNATRREMLDLTDQVMDGVPVILTV
jgi:hypothetical protein